MFDRTRSQHYAASNGSRLLSLQNFPFSRFSVYTACKIESAPSSADRAPCALPLRSVAQNPGQTALIITFFAEYFLLQSRASRAVRILRPNFDTQ